MTLGEASVWSLITELLAVAEGVAEASDPASQILGEAAPFNGESAGPVLDATQGSRGPSAATSIPGVAAAGGPGPGNQPGGDDKKGGGKPDSRRKRNMQKDAAQTALVDLASNASKVGTATGIINTAVGGGVALAEGLNEFNKNGFFSEEGARGMGGTREGGKRSQMEEALAEINRNQQYAPKGRK